MRFDAASLHFSREPVTLCRRSSSLSYLEPTSLDYSCRFLTFPQIEFENSWVGTLQSWIEQQHSRSPSTSLIHIRPPVIRSRHKFRRHHVLPSIFLHYATDFRPFLSTGRPSSSLSSIYRVHPEPSQQQLEQDTRSNLRQSSANFLVSLSLSPVTLLLLASPLMKIPFVATSSSSQGSVFAIANLLVDKTKRSIASTTDLANPPLSQLQMRLSRLAGNWAQKGTIDVGAEDADGDWLISRCQVGRMARLDRDGRCFW